jgi:hypothetical protein
VNKPRKTSGWIFIAIGLIVLLGMIGGTLYFNWLWRTHDDKSAQTEGVLFTFVLSGVSALITLAFIYLTRRSLEAAQDAIALQHKSLAATERLIDLERDSLKAMQDGTNLEREKWNLQLRVEPRTWLGLSGDVEKAHTIYYASNQPGHHPSDLVPQVMCYVWNPGQQSLRVDTIRIFRSGDKSIHVNQSIPGLIVGPNSIVSIDVTASLLKVLFRSLTPGLTFHFNTATQPFEMITAAISFDSWLTTTPSLPEVSSFYRVQTDHGMSNISIKESPTPFGM